jgi:hypothetical protein
MKGWKVDELGLARWLGGQRRPRRACDVAAGRWRLDVRRRQRLTCLRWVQELEERSGDNPSAVVVHCTEADRWLVVMDIDAWRGSRRASRGSWRP